MKKIFLILTILFLMSFKVYAEIEIYCPECKRHLYNYKFDEMPREGFVQADDFLPVKGISKPKEDDRMNCPLCSAPLNGYEYICWKNNVALPYFMFQTVTLYTKDEGGNFYWTPYNL